MYQTNESDFGQLLLDLGWIEGHEELERGLSIAHETGQPLGRVFMDRGYLSHREVQNLIEVQALIRDNYLTAAEGRRAVSFSSWSGVSIDCAVPFTAPGDLDPVVPYHNRLGQLLVASGYLSDETVEDALASSQEAGLQLGKLFTLRNHLCKNSLAAVLEAQKLIRSDLITWEQATTGLKVLRLGFQRAAMESSAEASVLPLGQLFSHAGVVTDKHIDDALEVSKINRQPLGQVLLIFALLSDRLLDSALELQTLIRSGRLRRSSAVRAMSLIHAKGMTLEEALVHVHEVSGENSLVTVSSFLQMTGLFEGHLREIERIEKSGLQSREQLPQLAAFVDEYSLRAAVRCTFLVRHSILMLEQALLAFHCSILTDTDIDLFLERTGWVSPNALNMIGKPPQERSQTLRVVA